MEGDLGWASGAIASSGRVDVVSAVLAAACGRTRARHVMVMVGLWPRLLSSFLLSGLLPVRSPHHQVIDTYQKRAACVPTREKKVKKKEEHEIDTFSLTATEAFFLHYQKQLPLVRKENRRAHATLLTHAPAPPPPTHPQGKRKNKQGEGQTCPSGCHRLLLL